MMTSALSVREYTKEEKVEFLGPLWDQLSYLDKDALWNATLVDAKKKGVLGWLGSLTVDDGITEKIMIKDRLDEQTQAAAAAFKSFVIFGERLEHLDIASLYYGYFPDPGSNNIKQQFFGNVTYRVSPSVLSSDAKENGVRWVGEIGPVNSFIENNYHNLIELIKYNLSADHPDYGMYYKPERPVAMGSLEGEFEGVDSNGRILVRAQYHHLYSLDRPMVVDRVIKKVAIQYTQGERVEWAQMAKEIFDLSGNIQTTLVGGIEDVSDEDALLVIKGDWKYVEERETGGRKRDAYMKFLGVSISVIDPETEELIGYGDFYPEESVFFLVPTYLDQCVDKALAIQLKAYLSQMN